ncbi:MAG: substrate-binding domain-containing protein [Bacteroidota bacterium]|nr:substrate-binding domain-containing protein [Bacteroidota bacterium]
MMLNKQSLILIVLVLTSLNFGCHRVRKPIPDSMVTGHTTIAADEALLPLINAELDVFHSQYNFATIDCKYGSEYDAINLLLQEKVRLALVTRPLNQKEMDFFKGKDINPESIILAYDAIAVIVHSDHAIKALTIAEISGILSGQLSNWAQLEQSGKTGSIKQILDTESSGIIRSLVDSLNLNEKITGDFEFAGDNKKVIELVAANPDAIGFIGYNWLSEGDNLKVQENLKKVNLVAVSGRQIADDSNSFKPSLSSLFNLEYPLTRKIYAIYADPSPGLARGFLAHLTSERGQKIIYRMGLKPENDFQRLVKINEDY